VISVPGRLPKQTSASRGSAEIICQIRAMPGLTGHVATRIVQISFLAVATAECHLRS
jgi:hypothetical protein